MNATIRVGSPGNNGAVTQSNTAVATAGDVAAAAASPPASYPASPAAGTEQTVTTSGTAGVANVGTLEQYIEQLVEQPDTRCPNRVPGAEASGQAPTTGAAASSQTGALNANVSIRVGSPGTDGAVTQVNKATASGTSVAQSVVMTTTGTNLTVALVLPLQAPGVALDDTWLWNWVWDGQWTPPTDGSDATAAWPWARPGTGSAQSPSPPPGLRASPRAVPP